METIAFFHIQMIEDPLLIQYEDSLEKRLKSIWPEIVYFNFDNHSGEEVYFLARQLSEHSKKIVIFMENNGGLAEGKVTGWLNFIIRRPAEKLLLWKGKNNLLDKMKNAFNHHQEISKVDEIINNIEMKLKVN